MSNENQISDEFSEINNSAQDTVHVTDNSEGNSPVQPSAVRLTEPVNMAAQTIRDIITEHASESNVNCSMNFLFDGSFEAAGVDSNKLKKGLAHLAELGFVREDSDLVEFAGFVYETLNKARELASYSNEQIADIFDLIDDNALAKTQESSTRSGSEKSSSEQLPKNSQIANLKPTKADKLSQKERKRKAGKAEGNQFDLGGNTNKLAVFETLLGTTTDEQDSLTPSDHREIAPFYIYAWMLQDNGVDYNKTHVAEMLHRMMGKSKPTIVTAVENMLDLKLLSETKLGKRIKFNPKPLNEITIPETVYTILTESLHKSIEEVTESKLLEVGFVEKVLIERASVSKKVESEEVEGSLSAGSPNNDSSNTDAIIQHTDIDKLNLVQLIESNAALTDKVRRLEEENKRWKDLFNSMVREAKGIIE